MKLFKLLLSTFRGHPKLSGIALVLALLLCVMLLRGGTTDDTAVYHEAKRSNFLVSIVEGGNLEAVNEVVVRNQVDGDSRVIFIIPEGTYVKEGDLIVELDAAEAEEELKDQQITYETSSAAFVTADNDLEIMKSTVDSETRAAELAETFARMDLEKFDELDRDQQLRTAELDIGTTEQALALDKDTFNWTQKLAEKGFETTAKVDSDSLKVRESENELEGKRSTHKMLKEYELVKAEAEFKSLLQEAGRELERVIKQGESKIAQAQADKNSAEATLKLNEEKLANMKEQLTHTKVYAPQDGLAVYAMSNSRYSSESMIEEGAQVRKRQELIKIPDTSKMKVSLKVHESHVGNVRAGLPAFVVLDSLPDERFRGEVTKVAILPDAQSRWGNPNLKVYTTEVVITDPLPDVKPGVSARAEIVVANLQDVITVPIQAVTTLKGQQVCYAKRLGGPEPVPVEIGMFNSSYIEIKSGLKEGDRIMLAPPVSEEVALDGGVLEETEGLDLPKEAPAEQPKQGGKSPSNAGEDGGKRPRGGGDQRAKMMKRFDTDGDGTLSDSEKEAMKKAFSGGGGGSPRGGQ
ncbi:MAG: efflux RND transporter periplasmic adaptor subunit [Verrucomicrobiales bacterium]|jgi:HlyD family secretion protein|nr:efflux RND transporter periplasmic adaptor subunit [Verrucomicrobiales bacterium]MDB4467960.1 efflux RND transporter periplasmic adaptor subunit [Verrucomicrobiales bacterium]MDB4789396.1 efflux RND transporter periplasmic adaptor subunit [Verrucomicrobiales bacterium]MDF1786984.1 efflux RND transporter periplasmic adaptor subunit [Verrucomicrobiales bacterium]